MIRSQLKDGVHYDLRDDDKELTADEMKLMQTQDINYIRQKRIIEMKKIEKLRQSLHLIDCNNRPKNKHIFFEDKKNFDFAERLKTDKKLLEMGFNFANLDQINETDVQNIAHLRDKSYKELAKRTERLKFLDILYQKMEVKRKLVVKKSNHLFVYLYFNSFFLTE